MLGINEISVLFSEVLLSAYPLLIKLSDASVYLQTGLRLATFSILAAVILIVTGGDLSTILTGETAIVGLLNLLHIGSSYIGFDKLSGGNAMALFYTYPIWNILGAATILGESVAISAIPWIGLACFGAIALAKPTGDKWALTGVIGALLAALTETGIYLWFKWKGDDDKAGKGKGKGPWREMLQMYGGSGLFWLIASIVLLASGIITPNLFTSSNIGNIVLFNSLIGFIGYAVRFYLIPKISTVLFSALSFFGVFSAYAFSWLFANETPTITQIIGAFAIVVANMALI